MADNFKLIGDPKKEYTKANAAGKKLLEALFGAAMFQPNIMEQVKTMDDVYRLAKVNPKDYAIKANMTARQKKHIYCDKIDLIAKVLNQDVVLKWENTDQRKWYPWFEWTGAKSGFGFSHAHCVYTHSGTDLGSRFATSELAEYAGKTFIKEYNDWLKS